MHNLSFNSARFKEHGDDGLVRFRADSFLKEKAIHDLISGTPFGSGEPDAWFSSANASAFVQSQFPDLWELARSIHTLLQRGVGAIVVENLPFAELDLSKSKRRLLAFASCIGRPISADPYRPSLVWPVSPRPEVSFAYTPTITEHSDWAELHTDSTFKAVPEDYVLLFAHQPASDGGGLSLLLSAGRLLAKLAETDMGRECTRLLHSQGFPFRVPTAFTRHRRDTDVEWITAPILSNRSQIRYRYDLIASALQCLPTPIPHDAAWALTHFRQELQQLSPSTFALKRGDLLVLNNCLVLHGRTAFEDRDRMLLRVRLANTHSFHPPEALTWQSKAAT